MTFIGGPAAEGLGAIMSKSLSEPIRSHKDLDKKHSAPYYHKAVKFYEGLSKQLVNQGHVLDVFAWALDQVCILTTSFGLSTMSRRVSVQKNSGDDQLPLGLICARVSLVGTNFPAGKAVPSKKFLKLTAQRMSKFKVLLVHVRLLTRNLRCALKLILAKHGNGQMWLRVTTLSRKWVAEPGILQDLITVFDQEAAAVVMSRIVSFKMETEAEFDPVRWLDRSLICLCSRFGEYQIDSPSSFQISSQFSIFPQFMFHFVDLNLYRSRACSPGCRGNSCRQNSSVGRLFHSCHISRNFHSSVEENGLSNQPEHEAFALLLKAPQGDAESIIKGRFPVPRLVVCDQHGSQARFLLAKFYPSATYNSDSRANPGGDIIFTDDVSLEVFLEHLRSLVVQ